MRLLARALVMGLTLMVAGAGSVVAQTSPYPVRHEELSTLWPSGLGNDHEVIMGRTTIQPGVAMPLTRFNGEWAVRVDSGVLTVSGIDGPVLDGDFALEEQVVVAGQAELRGGNHFSFGPDATMVWANEGSQPVVILTTAVVDGSRDPMTEIDPDAADAEPTPQPFRGKVEKRVVLKGPSKGLDGYRYRIIIRDHSGKLVGARVPRESELRFARGWLSFLEDGVIRIGPAAFIDGNVNEVLVTWITAVCGPVATIDIGKDVGAIRVKDDSPGCDAAGMDATVALRFRGSYTAVDEIAAELIWPD